MSTASNINPTQHWAFVLYSRSAFWWSPVSIALNCLKALNRCILLLLWYERNICNQFLPFSVRILLFRHFSYLAFKNKSAHTDSFALLIFNHWNRTLKRVCTSTEILIVEQQHFECLSDFALLQTSHCIFSFVPRFSNLMYYSANLD